VLLRLGLEPTPLVLGFILGPAFEEYLRRTLLFSRGDPMVLLTDPVSAVCLALIAAGERSNLEEQCSRQERAYAGANGEEGPALRSEEHNVQEPIEIRER
jgi:TctA family transporter